MKCHIQRVLYIGILCNCITMPIERQETRMICTVWYTNCYYYKDQCITDVIKKASVTKLRGWLMLSYIILWIGTACLLHQSGAIWIPSGDNVCWRRVLCRALYNAHISIMVYLSLLHLYRKIYISWTYMNSNFTQTSVVVLNRKWAHLYTNPNDFSILN